MRMLTRTLIAASAALACWLIYASWPKASSADGAAGHTACASRFSSSDTSLRAVLPTDAGLHMVWTPSAFAHICDYDAWEKELLEDSSLERHIAAGRLVPLNLHSDGAPAIELRVETGSPDTPLPASEQAWVRATSEPYLLVSEGVVNVSGIEYMGGSADGAIRSIALPAGRWLARVSYLEAPDAARSTDQLYPPDLLVRLWPEPLQPGTYRQSVETFDELP